MAFSAPILDKKDSKLLGIVVQRVAVEKLFKITTDRTGIGETGEYYLVNQYGYMITPPDLLIRFFFSRRLIWKI